MTGQCSGLKTRKRKEGPHTVLAVIPGDLSQRLRGVSGPVSPVSDQRPVVVTVSEVTPAGRAGETSALPSTSLVASPEVILLCSHVSNLAA